MTPIALLRPAPRNARRHGKAQLAALERSVTEHGMVSPVIRDENNYIIAGHGRVEAAKRAGKTVVPTLQIKGWNDGQKRLFALADNRIAELSTWDEAARAEEFRELRLEMPDLDLTLSGFEHPAIEFAIASLEQTNWSDLDKLPEGNPAVTVTRLGDIWDYKNGHTIACGDSTKPETVAEAVGGETVQLVEKAAPYNLRATGYSGKGKHQHGNFSMGAREMGKEEFRVFLAASYEAI